MALALEQVAAGARHARGAVGLAQQRAHRLRHLVGPGLEDGQELRLQVGLVASGPHAAAAYSATFSGAIPADQSRPSASCGATPATEAAAQQHLQQASVGQGDVHDLARAASLARVARPCGGAPTKVGALA